MTLLTGAPLDLSQLPPFQLVAVDYEAERAALIAGIVARFQAAGVPYDVDALETDSAVILAEEFAYRKTLDLQALNDAGKRLVLASSYGGALDHIAATYYADLGVQRAVLTPADPVAGTAAVMETDDRFRRRIQLAPEARTPGTLGGYEYAALTAAPALYDARALNYASGLCAPGQILVVVLGRDPDPDPAFDVPALDEAAQLVLAQNALLNRNTKLGSDEVIVRVARRVPVPVSAVLGIPIGPDPALVVAGAVVALNTYCAEVGQRIGEIFAEAGQMAAMKVGGVRRVVLTGTTADIDPGSNGVAKAAIGAITTDLVSV